MDKRTNKKTTDKLTPVNRTRSAVSKDKQSPARKTRRDSTYHRIEHKTTYSAVKTVSARKPLTLIWQRLSAGTHGSTPKKKKPCSNSRNEPAWREILNEEHENRTDTVSSNECYTNPNATPTGGVKIKMERTTERYTTTREVNQSALDKLDSTDEMEPIDEFKEFFGNLFNYLQERVPVEERGFLCNQNEKFQAFFDRLKSQENNQNESENVQMETTKSQTSYKSVSNRDNQRSRKAVQGNMTIQDECIADKPTEDECTENEPTEPTEDACSSEPCKRVKVKEGKQRLNHQGKTFIMQAQSVDDFCTPCNKEKQKKHKRSVRVSCCQEDDDSSASRTEIRSKGRKSTICMCKPLCTKELKKPKECKHFQVEEQNANSLNESPEKHISRKDTTSTRKSQHKSHRNCPTAQIDDPKGYNNTEMCYPTSRKNSTSPSKREKSQCKSNETRFLTQILQPTVYYNTEECYRANSRGELASPSRRETQKCRCKSNQNSFIAPNEDNFNTEECYQASSRGKLISPSRRETGYSTLAQIEEPSEDQNTEECHRQREITRKKIRHGVLITEMDVEIEEHGGRGVTRISDSKSSQCASNTSIVDKKCSQSNQSLSSSSSCQAEAENEEKNIQVNRVRCLCVPKQKKAKSRTKTKVQAEACTQTSFCSNQENCSTNTSNISIKKIDMGIQVSPQDFIKMGNFKEFCDGFCNCDETKFDSRRLQLGQQEAAFLRCLKVCEKSRGSNGGENRHGSRSGQVSPKESNRRGNSKGAKGADNTCDCDESRFGSIGFQLSQRETAKSGTSKGAKNQRDSGFDEINRAQKMSNCSTPRVDNCEETSKRSDSPKMKRQIGGESAAVSQELENLESIRNEIMRNPNIDVLLKLVKSYYKRVKREHKTQRGKTTEPTSSCAHSESADTSQQDNVKSNDFKKFESTITLLNEMDSPLNEFILFMQSTIPTAQSHDESSFESAVSADSTATAQHLKSPQKCSTKILEEPLTSQIDLHQEIDSICVDLMETKNNLAMLRKEIEKDTLHIVEEEANVEPHCSTQLEENKPSSQLAEWPICSLNLGGKSYENFDELSLLINDHMAKSNLDDIKHKVVETEKLQQAEIENVLKKKPHIDENFLLHKLDTNMEQMQATLLNLGKQFNYLPIEYLNQNCQPKWKPIEANKSTILLDSFKNCYPEKINTCKTLERAAPGEIKPYENSSEEGALLESLLNSENVGEFESSLENINEYS